MRAKGFIWVLPWLSLWVGSAAAQEVDPIGALLETPSPTPTPPTDAAAAIEAPPISASIPPTAPEAVPVTSPVPLAAPLVIAPRPNPYEPPPRPWLRLPTLRPSQGVPVKIDETGRTPDGPPTASDLNYEGRLRSTFDAAEGLQGPLDGHWVVRVAGIELYDLQLVDKGQGTLEGAWRDPRRAGAADASGFIDSISRNGGQLVARFQSRRSGGPVELTLDAGVNGQWSGQVLDRGDHHIATMTRN